MGEMASAMMIGGEAAASGAGMLGAGAEGIGAAGTAGAALGGANAAVGAGGGVLQGIPVLGDISTGAQQAFDAAIGMKDGPVVGMVETNNPVSFFSGAAEQAMDATGGGVYSSLTGTNAMPISTAPSYNPFFSAINTGIDKVADNTITPVANMVKSGVNAIGDAASSVGNWVSGNETLQQIGGTAKHFDDRFLGGIGQDAVSGAKDMLAKAWNDMPEVLERKKDGSIDGWKTAGNMVYKGGKASLLGAMNRGNQPALTLDTSAPKTNAKKEEAADSEEELRLLREKIR